MRSVVLAASLRSAWQESGLCESPVDGVRFKLENKSILEDYQRLYSYWNEDRKKKRLKKFKTIQLKK